MIAVNCNVCRARYQEVRDAVELEPRRTGRSQEAVQEPVDALDKREIRGAAPVSAGEIRRSGTLSSVI